jgi:peptide/nickel transport system substrate-binding protein
VGEDNRGTGPFRLVRRDPGGLELERFDNYYLGAPQIERIVVRPSDTLRTSWTRLLRGEVDMVTDVPPDAVEFIQNDDIQVISFRRSYEYLIAFNSAAPPFRSPAVRRAMNTAVNRELLITNALQGQGESATGPIWPKHWAYDASAQPFGFDSRLPPLTTVLPRGCDLPAWCQRGSACWSGSDSKCKSSCTTSASI